MKEVVRRQRNGTWDGIPGGMRLVVDSDGNGRLHRTTVDKGSIKSKDVQKPEEVTALLTLGSPKTSTNKLSSEDEGLGEALHDLLNDEGIPPVAQQRQCFTLAIVSERIPSACIV